MHLVPISEFVSSRVELRVPMITVILSAGILLHRIQTARDLFIVAGRAVMIYVTFCTIEPEKHEVMS